MHSMIIIRSIVELRSLVMLTLCQFMCNQEINVLVICSHKKTILTVLSFISHCLITGKYAEAISVLQLLISIIHHLA